MRRSRPLTVLLLTAAVTAGCSTLDALDFRDGPHTGPTDASQPLVRTPTEPSVPDDRLTADERAMADAVLDTVDVDLAAAGDRLERAGDLLSGPAVTADIGDLQARLDELQGALGDRAAALEQADLDDNIRALLQFELSASQDQLADLQSQLAAGTTGQGDSPTDGDPVTDDDITGELGSLQLNRVLLPKIELLTAVGMLDQHGQNLVEAADTLDALIESWYSRGGDTTELVVAHDRLRRQADQLLEQTLKAATATVNLTGEQSGDTAVLSQAYQALLTTYVEHLDVLDTATEALRQLP